MSEAHTTWTCQYSIAGLSAALRKCNVTERATNELSSAEHTFVIKDAVADGLDLSTIMDLLVAQRDKPIQFWFASASGEETRRWSHLIARVRLTYSPNNVTDPRLVLTTVEQLAVMNCDDKNRVHTTHAGSISTLVKAIIEDNGLKVGKIADTGAVDDFLKIRQCNFTDYQLIINHLIPRASGGDSGFRLYTVGGDTVCFSPLSYSAPEVILDPALIDRVDEVVDCYATLKAGGHMVKGESLDPMTKLIVGAYSEGEDGVTGTEGPSWKRLSYLYAPTQTQTAINCVVSAHQRGLSSRSFPIAFKAVGRARIGEGDGVLPEFPMKLTLPTGTKYRGADGHSAYLAEIAHSLEGGLYEVLLRCERGKINNANNISTNGLPTDGSAGSSGVA